MTGKNLLTKTYKAMDFNYIPKNRTTKLNCKLKLENGCAMPVTHM